MSTAGWLNWGYLMGALAQLVIVVVVVCVLVVIVSETIRVTKNSWKRRR